AAAEHVVDDDLQGPRFRELEEADPEHLEERRREQPAVRDQPAEDLPREPHGAAHEALRRQAARARGAARSAPSGWSAMRAATMSSASFRMRPRRTFSATITPRLTRPSAAPTPMISGMWKRSPPTTAAPKPSSESCETRVSRTSQRTLRSRLEPPWFSAATVSCAFDQTPRYISRSQRFQPGSTAIRYLRGMKKSMSAARSASFSWPCSLQ